MELLEISKQASAQMYQHVIVWVISIALVAIPAVAYTAAYSGLSRSKKRVFMAVAIPLASASLVVTAFGVVNGEAKDKQTDASFARVLQETYGSTSSKSYSQMRRDMNYETELTRDGKTALVRFVQRDGKLTPIVLSSEDYPTLSAAK